jgi:hypothetical protein
MDEAIAHGKTTGKVFARIALEHQQALVRAETATKLATKSRVALEKHRERCAGIVQRSEQIAARRRHLEPQRTIRQLDTTQDTIRTATKLTALQLISFALREYLPSMPMRPQTFIQRALYISGRKAEKQIDRDQELVIFYEKPRDPQVNEALRDACAQVWRIQEMSGRAIDDSRSERSHECGGDGALGRARGRPSAHCGTRPVRSEGRELESCLADRRPG